MIAVIADDLSGAAELAGIAFHAGLAAEVQTTFHPNSSADLIAFDTDSRACSRPEAVRRVTRAVRDILRVRPVWIYKKTDSVMRGHVHAEIEAILQETGQSTALFIPANPTKHRVIRDGVYYVDERPLSESAFAQDPLYPARDSRVTQCLNLEGGRPVRGFSHQEPCAGTGILVPDAFETAHLSQRASELTGSMVPAGGVEFFQALLHRHLAAHSSPRHEVIGASCGPETKTLFVCGSAAAWQTGRLRDCQTHHVPIALMPDGVLDPEDRPGAIRLWSDEAIRLWQERCRVMMAIGRAPDRTPSVSPERLLDGLMDAVSWVLDRERVHALCLEGGATAAALLHRRGWNRLRAASSLGGEMTGFLATTPAATPFLFIKPGSYPWPRAVWKFGQGG